MLPLLQSAIRAIYPPECLLCREMVETEFGLCGACGGQTPFIGGAVCDICGAPQIGAAEDGIVCDECLLFPRSWARGRAALRYAGSARDLVLALKHGDRQDIARPAGAWLARAAAPLLREHMIVAPVPLHWTRLARRRYNQSALLAQSMAQVLGLPWSADLMQRHQRTASLEGQDRLARQETLRGAVRVNPRRRSKIAGGRPVLLVDDVLTTGATLDACADALVAAGAGEVSVVALARAAKDT